MNENIVKLTARAPARHRPAERFVRAVLARLEHGRLAVTLPSGERIEHTASVGGPCAAIELSSWRAVLRTMTGGAVGFAESYMDGEWTSPDLPALLSVFVVNRQAIDGVGGSAASRALRRFWHIVHSNTKRGSRRNIRHHYDLGNEFYRRWLDAGMQYSSAMYEQGDDLESAQQRKLDRIVGHLALEGGERVLEIGCGWGAVAERLTSRHGCHVTGLTLSEEQHDFAARRLHAIGQSERADFRLEDYRDCEGTYDRIVSIEMIEAVGEKYWPQYFEILRRRLRPGGIAVIQAITIAPHRFERYRRDADFIQRYIFPGGMLPTAGILETQIGEAGLDLQKVEFFGESYARTLAEWRRRFHSAWSDIETYGFDERFRRMWDYYLSYCEAGFSNGCLDVGLLRVKG